MHALLLLIVFACGAGSEAKDEQPTGEVPELRDGDGDGYAGGLDCDDDDPSVFLGGVEHCDSVDNDCDGAIDEASAAALSWYRDGDGDGWGAPESLYIACSAPSDFTLNSYDCDDDDASINPTAVEVCDAVVGGLDNDCDGVVDEDAVGARWWYPDADGDGAGDAALGVEACEAPEGFLRVGEDCDDLDPSVNPDALERCDGVDEDCDGVIDEESVDALPFYTDDDGDGYGFGAAVSSGCSTTEGLAINDLDCDDSDSALNQDDVDVDGYSTCAGDCDESALFESRSIHPGADELCDAIDQDCDGLIDEDSLDGWIVYTDADEDGYGDPDGAVEVCVDREGHVTNDLDCDDGDAALSADDSDSDGVSTCGGDCDDGDEALSPERLEVCGDAADNDCDGEVDEEACPRNLSDADVTFLGDSASYAGVSISGVGDLDDDGLEELIVGASHDSTGADDGGAAYLFSGASLASLSGEVSLADADLVLLGDAEDANVGAVVYGPGDIDGDGTGDLLIAYPRAEYGGVVYLLYGDTAASLTGEQELNAIQTFAIVSFPSSSGVSIRGAGDVDGDGKMELVSGSCERVDDSAWLLFGDGIAALSGGEWVEPIALELLPDTDGEYTGCAVSGAGDVDGDGLDDVLVGVYGDDNDGGVDAGAALLLFGDSVADEEFPFHLGNADTKYIGSSDGAHLGSALEALGDIDEDGYDDFLLAADQEGAGGAVYLMMGGGSFPSYSETTLATAQVSFLGGAAGARAGSSVSVAGDVDGDELTDLLIGASDEGVAGEGAAYLMLGSTVASLAGVVNLHDADIIVVGESEGEGAGGAVSAADLDGDGLDDILIGAPGADTAYLFFSAGL